MDRFSRHRMSVRQTQNFGTTVNSNLSRARRHRILLRVNSNMGRDSGHRLSIRQSTPTWAGPADTDFRYDSQQQHRRGQQTQSYDESTATYACHH